MKLHDMIMASAFSGNAGAAEKYPLPSPVYLTQEEYDAVSQPEPATTYVITEGGSIRRIIRTSQYNLLNYEKMFSSYETTEYSGMGYVYELHLKPFTEYTLYTNAAERYASFFLTLPDENASSAANGVCHNMGGVVRNRTDERGILYVVRRYGVDPNCYIPELNDFRNGTKFIQVAEGHDVYKLSPACEILDFDF